MWGEGLSFIFSFILSILSARYLGISGKGEYNVLTTGAFLLVSIVSLRFQHSVTYFCSQDVNNKGQIILAGSLVGILMTLILFIMLKLLPIIFQNYLFNNITYNINTILFLCVGYYLWSFLIGLLAGTKEFGLRSLLIAGVPLMNIILVVICGKMLRMKVTDILFYNGFIQTVVCTFFLLVLFLKSEHRFFNLSLFIEMLVFSVKIFPSLISDIAILRIDTFIVNYFSGAAQVGLYSVAISAANIVLILPTVVKTVLLPYIINNKEINTITETTIKMTILIMLIFCIISVPLLWFLIIPIYGMDFADARILYLILLPGTIFWGIYNILCTSIEGHGNPALVSLASTAGVIITLVLDIILIRSSGALGASIASTLSYSITMILVLVIYNKFVEPIHIFPTAKDIRRIPELLKIHKNI